MAGYLGQALRNRATLCKSKAMPMAAMALPRSSALTSTAMTTSSISSSAYPEKQSLSMKPQTTVKYAAMMGIPK